MFIQKIPDLSKIYYPSRVLDSSVPRYQYRLLEAITFQRVYPASFPDVTRCSCELLDGIVLRDCIQSIIAWTPNRNHFSTESAPRPTFADAKNKRPASFCETLFELVYQNYRTLFTKHKLSSKTS